jgi:hypothetical protein
MLRRGLWYFGTVKAVIVIRKFECIEIYVLMTFS